MLMIAYARGGPIEECDPEMIGFELVTGYVFSAPTDLLDSLPGTLMLTDCLESCQANDTCQAVNYETGLCVLFGSNADSYPGEYSHYRSMIPPEEEELSARGHRVRTFHMCTRRSGGCFQLKLHVPPRRRHIYVLSNSNKHRTNRCYIGNTRNARPRCLTYLVCSHSYRRARVPQVFPWNPPTRTGTSGNLSAFGLAHICYKSPANTWSNQFFTCGF